MTGRPSAVTTPSGGAPTGTGVRIALLSTSDTDLLAARSSHAAYALANPSELDVDTELAGVVEGADVVIVRILGTARSWQQGLDLLIASKVLLLVLDGEQTPDAELMRLSTVPIGIAGQAQRYLAEGGPINLRQVARVRQRHGAAERRRLRAAGRATGLGCTPPPRTADLDNAPAVDQRAVLPRAPGVGQHQLRPHPGRCHRCRRQRRTDLHLQPPECRRQLAR